MVYCAWRNLSVPVCRATERTGRANVLKLLVLDGNSIVNRAFYGIKAVSYTHLDVYKRQVPGRCGARAGPAYGFRMFCHCCFSFFRLCQKNTAVPAYTAHTPHAERLMALPSAKPGVW